MNTRPAPQATFPETLYVDHIAREADDVVAQATGRIVIWETWWLCTLFDGHPFIPLIVKRCEGVWLPKWPRIDEYARIALEATSDPATLETFRPGDGVNVNDVTYMRLHDGTLVDLALVIVAQQLADADGERLVYGIARPAVLKHGGREPYPEPQPPCIAFRGARWVLLVAPCDPLELER